VAAHDEVLYFSGQVGGSFPDHFSSIDNVGGSFEPGTTASSLELQKSLLYGAKVGMYSKSGILGMESEVFNTNPHIKPQRQVFFEPTSGPFSSNVAGSRTRLTTWAVNVVGRYPLCDHMEIYAGIGPAMFFAHMDREGQSQSSNRFGLNTQLGINYVVASHWSVFAEWKFNHTRFKFATQGDTEGFHATYNAHGVVVGITRTFDVSLPWQSKITLRNLFKKREE
jgi:opacity protein-like surface antigen